MKFSCFTNKKCTPTLAYSLLPIDQNLVGILWSLFNCIIYKGATYIVYKYSIIHKSKDGISKNNMLGVK